MIDLSPEYLDIIKQLIRQYVPDTEVWAFGSRVNWTAKDYSDLDLVLKGEGKIPQKKYFQLQDALEESDLPIKVDVLDWNRLTPELQANIEKNYETILTPAQGEERGWVIMSDWPRVKISDVCQLIVDCVNKTAPRVEYETIDRVNGKYPVYGSGGLTGTHNYHLVDGPGIIVGRKGTVGSLYWEDNSFYAIDTVFYVKCRDNMTLLFSFYLLETLGLEEMNTDAAVPGLNRNNAYRLEIPKYPGDLVESFTNIVSGFRNKVRLINEEIITLEIIRDTLLPKLLSGELNINQTAIKKEAVA